MEESTPQMAEMAPEWHAGATYQVPVSQIEVLTGLDLEELRMHDPLAPSTTEEAFGPQAAAIEGSEDLYLVREPLEVLARQCLGTRFAVLADALDEELELSYALRDLHEHVVARAGQPDLAKRLARGITAGELANAICARSGGNTTGPAAGFRGALGAHRGRGPTSRAHPTADPARILRAAR